MLSGVSTRSCGISWSTHLPRPNANARKPEPVPDNYPSPVLQKRRSPARPWLPLRTQRLYARKRIRIHRGNTQNCVDQSSLGLHTSWGMGDRREPVRNEERGMDLAPLDAQRFGMAVMRLIYLESVCWEGPLLRFTAFAVNLVMSESW